MIINVINDAPGGQSCNTWGTEGDDRIPIIINETTFGEAGYFNNWFAGSGDWINPYSSPWYILIDDEFNYNYISSPTSSHDDIIDAIDILLEN